MDSEIDTSVSFLTLSSNPNVIPMSKPLPLFEPRMGVAPSPCFRGGEAGTVSFEVENDTVPFASRVWIAIR